MEVAMAFCQACLLRGESRLVLRLVEIIITFHLKAEYTVLLGAFLLMFSYCLLYLLHL